MKYLLSSIALAGLALTGCAGTVMDLDSQRAMVIDGEPTVVEVRDKRSFDIEVAPHKAVCMLTAADGSQVKGECLQYRQPFQKDYNLVSGGIEGFNFEPGYRYLLDVRQVAVPDPVNGIVRSKWVLNKVKDKKLDVIKPMV